MNKSESLWQSEDIFMDKIGFVLYTKIRSDNYDSMLNGGIFIGCGIHIIFAVRMHLWSSRMNQANSIVTRKLEIQVELKIQ